MTVPKSRVPVVEKLIYITPDGESFSLHEPSAKRAVTQVEGFGMPPYDVNTTRSPYQHGETPLSVRLNPRTIRVTLRHSECDRSSYWGTRSTLVDRMRPNRVSLNASEAGVLRRIYYINGVKTIRDVKVFLREGLVFSYPAASTWDMFGINEQLVFEALDPVIYDPTASTATITTFTAELDLAMVFPFVLGSYVNTQNVTYTGTWFSFPTVVATGPIADLGIINTAIDKRVSLEYVISAGEVVTFDLRDGVKTITNDAGVDLLPYALNSDLVNFAVHPDPYVAGGLNPIQFICTSYGAGSSIVFSYYTRYIGI